MAAKPFTCIPGPKGWPIIGSVFDYSRFGKYSFERMHLAKMDNYKKYGPIYKEKLGRNIVQLFDPADVGLVYRSEGRFPIRPPLPLPVVAHKKDNERLGFGNLNGEPWWEIRKAVHQTMMKPTAALPYLPVQNLVADDLVKLIGYHLNYQPGEIMDLLGIITRFTMEAFGTICFSVRMGCLQPHIPANSQTYEMMSATSAMFQAVQKTTFSFPLYAIYRTPLYRQFITASHICHRIAQSYVDEVDHRSRDQDSGDLSVNFLRTLVDDSTHQMRKSQMIGLAIDLFSAGIDSTGYALSFCLYNLARNADQQDKLRQEIDHFLPGGTPLTADVLSRLHYLKACVKESFRINSPVEGGPIRELEKDLVLSEYHVPKGTLVSLNFQTMCLLEKYFHKTDQFIPERWLKDDSTSTCPPPGFVCLPFGYGTRMCIGRRFAEQLMYLAVIKILQRYRLEYNHTNRIGMISRVFTMPDGPIRITFVPR